MEAKTKKTLGQLNVGDEVAIVPGYARDLRYNFGYKVVKITPKRQYVVRRAENVDKPCHELKQFEEMRFDACGYRMDTSASKYNRDRIEADVEAARAHTDQQTRSHAAAEALETLKHFQVRSTYTKESMQGIVAELEAKLAAAKALVEAI